MVIRSANNSIGSIYVSGFTAAMKIKHFIMFPFDSLGTVVSTFTSQNLGYGKYRRIHIGIKKGMIIKFDYEIVARMSVQGLFFSERAVISCTIEMVARIFVSVVFIPISGYTAICCANQTTWVTACIYIVPMCFLCL